MIQEHKSGSQKSLLTLVGVGDISPQRDDPPSIFRHCGDVFRTADFVFGQMEVPISDRGNPNTAVHRRLPPKNVSALTEEGAGFDVMSFATNHGMDYGWDAFFDTLDILKKNNIAVVGAGKNITEARKPTIIEKDGTRVGFLAYLSVYPTPILIAKEDRPGCAPLRASHYYQESYPTLPTPGTPPLVVTELFPEDKKAFEEDIKKLRPQVDVVVVSMHCGVPLLGSIIAMYQKEAGYAAIDAGADLILQHHAHILKGIEMYKGKAIFYGLGNFALEHVLDPSGKVSSIGSEVHGSLFKQFNRIKPEPGYEKHRFHHDSLKTMIAKAYIQDKKIQKVTYIPAYINPNLEPEVVTRKDPRAQEVFDYVEQISDSEDLDVRLSWEGDEVLVSHE
ncbi:CapA family protein [Chloroflexota bacterium]